MWSETFCPTGGPASRSGLPVSARIVCPCVVLVLVHRLHLVVRDDDRPRLLGGRVHAVPPWRERGVRPAEERLGVPRGEVHATVALHVTELGVPERAVERDAAVEVLDPRDVL